MTEVCQFLFQQRRKLLIALFFACVLPFLVISRERGAVAVPRGEMYVPSYQSGDALLPDWERITFRLIPVASRAGALDLSAFTGVLGYNPSRTWNAGDSITSIVMLGDLAEATNLPGRNLQSILNLVGLSAHSFTLADFGVVDKQTIGTLVAAVPSLSTVNLGDIPPLYDLVKKELGNVVPSMLQNMPVGQILNMDEIAGLSLDALDLSQYGIDAIPGLLNADLDNFSQWGSTVIGEIPGLAALPFAEFFTDLGSDGPFAFVDIVFGEKEGQRSNTVTGSDRVGFSYPCQQENCAHIELAAPDWQGVHSLQGKQWISGDSQWVAGGSGCLAGKEPTGRHPFGKGFKVVLTTTNEATGLAEFGIYFRFNLFCGKSPYIIGPFPWMSQYEKDIIFLGLD